MEFNLMRLKAERVARGLTQEDVAKTLGVKKSTYSKKENGEIKLGVDEFAKILTRLECPESEAFIFFKVSVPEKERKAGVV